MPQEPKSRAEIQAIIDNISFLDRNIRLIPKGVDEKGNEFFCLQLEYMEEDIDNPGKTELQRARKWYISPYSTETEIVEAAFAACKRSMEHVIKEHFTYKGERVYSPHFDINARLRMCKEFKFDGRKPLFNKWHVYLLSLVKSLTKDGLTGAARELEQYINKNYIDDEESFRNTLSSVLLWEAEYIDDVVKKILSQ